MAEDVFHIKCLPVMELTPCGTWLMLGFAHGVTLVKRGHGRGFRYMGQAQSMDLLEPMVALEVLRWQTDRIIVQRIVRG